MLLDHIHAPGSHLLLVSIKYLQVGHNVHTSLEIRVQSLLQLLPVLLLVAAGLLIPLVKRSVVDFVQQIVREDEALS